jgi:hypothetical protein
MKLPYSKDEFIDRRHEFINQCNNNNYSILWVNSDPTNHTKVATLTKNADNANLDYLYNQIFFGGHMKRFSFMCMAILSAPIPRRHQLDWFGSNAQMYIKNKNYPSTIERSIGYGLKIKFYLSLLNRIYLIHPKFIIAHQRSYPSNLVVSYSHYECINTIMSYFYEFDRDFLI